MGTVSPAAVSLVVAQAHGDGSAGAIAAGNVDLLVFLVVGLLAGAHCLGMCGPLVTAYADRFNPQRGTKRGNALTLYEVRQHSLFNLGRAGSYALLGGLFGLLGGLAFASVDAVSGGRGRASERPSASSSGSRSSPAARTTSAGDPAARTGSPSSAPRLRGFRAVSPGGSTVSRTPRESLGWVRSTVFCRVRSFTRRICTRSRSATRFAGRCRSVSSDSGRSRPSSPTGRRSGRSEPKTGFDSTACSVSRSSFWGTFRCSTG